VLVQTAGHLVGVEVKRYEHVSSVTTKEFSEAYRRPVWGNSMGPFERMRDELKPGRYKHLNAVQLVKHAFGLRTEAARPQRQGRKPVLLYLYAEPAAWPDGRPVDRTALARHADEVRDFAAAVEGAEVRFAACTFAELRVTLQQSSILEVRAHADALAGRFEL
jgi:hypothetical protein